MRRIITQTGIISVSDGIVFVALDHDFHCGSLVPSVLLCCNITRDMSGSFFCGDEDEGYGQIFVTLRDAIFDPSKVFDHTSQLIDTVDQNNIKPPVLVFRSDAVVDRSIKRL